MVVESACLECRPLVQLQCPDRLGLLMCHRNTCKFCRVKRLMHNPDAELGLVSLTARPDN